MNLQMKGNEDEAVRMGMATQEEEEWRLGDR